MRPCVWCVCVCVCVCVCAVVALMPWCGHDDWSVAARREMCARVGEWAGARAGGRGAAALRDQGHRA